MFVKNFTIQGMSAPHKQGIPELKENYFCVILGLT